MLDNKIFYANLSTDEFSNRTTVDLYSDEFRFMVPPIVDKYLKAQKRKTKLGAIVIFNRTQDGRTMKMN